MFFFLHVKKKKKKLYGKIILQRREENPFTKKTELKKVCKKGQNKDIAKTRKSRKQEIKRRKYYEKML